MSINRVLMTSDVKKLISFFMSAANNVSIHDFGPKAIIRYEMYCLSCPFVFVSVQQSNGGEKSCSDFPHLLLWPAGDRGWVYDLLQWSERCHQQRWPLCAVGETGLEIGLTFSMKNVSKPGFVLWKARFEIDVMHFKGAYTHLSTSLHSLWL